jgi:hypothetical protein
MPPIPARCFANPIPALPSHHARAFVRSYDTLPKPGRVNAFLELRGIEPQQGVLQRIWSQEAQRVALRLADSRPSTSSPPSTGCTSLPPT